MNSPEFVEDSIKWRGHELTGRHTHWCPEWDGLPMDETCPEWPCGCEISDRVEAQTGGER